MYLLPKAIRDRISSTMIMHFSTMYSYLSNNHGGWNKRGGGAKVAKSINVEGGNVRGGWIIFSKSISVTPRLLER